MRNEHKPFAPFSKNSKEYILCSEHAWFNVLEGSKRGTKNVTNTFAFCRLLEHHPNDLHLIAGYTSGAAGALIYKSDGFGIERYFDGRCSTGKYEGKPCYFIQTATGEKTILRAGGRDILSQDFIAGFTFGMAYITEVNRCHPNFIEEVFSRTFSSQRRKVFHDLNPKSEGHWYYTDVLAQYEKLKAADPTYGYNYGHLTMADNLSMSDEQIREAVRSVKKGTVWYARDILGQRRQAEGLVYEGVFNPDTCVEKPTERQYRKYRVSIDYGARNPFVALLWGLGFDGVWYCIDEYYHSGRTDGRMEVTQYITEMEKMFAGCKIEWIIFDPSASVLDDSLYRKYKTVPADNDVSDGIENVATALHAGLIKFSSKCINTIREFGLYSWNDKRNDADVVVKENDHCMDSVRYFVHTSRIVEDYKRRRGA